MRAYALLVALYWSHTTRLVSHFLAEGLAELGTLRQSMVSLGLCDAMISSG